MNCVDSKHGANGCRGAATLQVSNFLADEYMIDQDECTPYLATDGHTCQMKCESSTETFHEYSFDRTQKDSFSYSSVQEIQ